MRSLKGLRGRGEAVGVGYYSLMKEHYNFFGGVDLFVGLRSDVLKDLSEGFGCEVQCPTVRVWNIFCM